LCTVSWLHTATGFALFCNRDEQRTRGPEKAPSRFERAGVSYLSPRDGDFGGTWVSVNEFGLAVTLLNGYTKTRGESRAQWTSRGLLVDGLAHLENAVTVREQLLSIDLREYQPFQLLAIDAAGGLASLRWDGLVLESLDDPNREMPLVSSGVEAPEVRAHRKALLADMTPSSNQLTEDLLASYHSSHGAGPSAYSTCMHREDAKTRSLCRIRVDDRRVQFDYKPGSPCKTEWAAPLQLTRRNGLNSHRAEGSKS
jgi:hypothetical protein